MDSGQSWISVVPVDLETGLRTTLDWFRNGAEVARGR